MKTKISPDCLVLFDAWFADWQQLHREVVRIDIQERTKARVRAFRKAAKAFTGLRRKDQSILAESLSIIYDT